MAHTSALFPRVLADAQAQVTEHHDVLGRHGRVMSSHTAQLVTLTERVSKLENADHAVALDDFERRIGEKVQKLEIDVAKLRTAIYIGALLVGGSVAGSKAVDVATPQKPAVIQLTPEAIEALKP